MTVADETASRGAPAPSSTSPAPVATFGTGKTAQGLPNDSGAPTMNGNGTASTGSPQKAAPAPASAPAPGWVYAVSQLVLIGATVLSGWGVLYLGPRYFKKSSGAIEYTIAAIPFYFALMLVELALMQLSKALRVAQAARYSLADSWSSITAGATQQLVIVTVISPLLKAIGPYFGYALIWEKAALFRPDVDAWPIWIAGFFTADFAYYWAHRFYHTNQLFWAGHQVHHSSEHYNLSTALRQSWWQAACGELLKLPFALFIPPQVYLINSSLNTVYQFWVHTCLVDRLGPIEWFFSTPSHHRVHHDRRVHKNFGGVLIIWDRIFGSFLDEAEDVRRYNWDRKQEEIELYGVIRPVESWLEPCLQYTGFQTILGRIKRHFLIKGFSLVEFARILVVGPGWTTVMQKRTLRPTKDDASRLRLRRPFSSHVVAIYFFAQFLMYLTAAVIGLLFIGKAYTPALAGIGFAFALSVTLALFLDFHPLAAAAHVTVCITAIALFLPYWCPAVFGDLFGLPAGTVWRVQLGLSALHFFGLLLTLTGLWPGRPAASAKKTH
ncbi:sterol desaturase [Salpingoeca rosetta]|uniref:Sterol desaturase n=1 Tax=Salpingoeca rosetta (strain ATCC 50818 / BSB-021) TaxID=946362 RepID=F2U4U2_SALR5|nr:sterol desaturase [Salpingoeca rosetta]EGD82658.1 sterol desaturase [Salpingoeca rosetta]|eukprot:XP_004995894.1 sterol desaturase [Salpingoeca rosetta]